MLRGLRGDVKKEIGGDKNSELRYDPITFDARPLSSYVAASGAFPVAFSAVRVAMEWRSVEYEHDLGAGLLAIPRERLQSRTFALADGGITDNSGYLFAEGMRQASNDVLRMAVVAKYYMDRLQLKPAARKAWEKFVRGQPLADDGWRYRHILVSDASERFADVPETQGVLAEASRSLDVVYSNTGLGRLDRFADEERAKNVDLVLSGIDCQVEKEKQQASRASVTIDCSDQQVLSRFTRGAAWLKKVEARLGTLKSQWLLGPQAWPELKPVARGTTFRLLADTYRAQKCAHAKALLDEEVWRILKMTDSNLAAALSQYRDELAAGEEVCPGGHVREVAKGIDEVLAPRIESAKRVFDRVATLDDTVTLSDAQSIAFLGRMSVLLNWPSIRTALASEH
ncbi:MAG: hypothetical protein QM757_47060 [Paludibaculum sp.]